MFSSPMPTIRKYVDLEENSSPILEDDEFIILTLTCVKLAFSIEKDEGSGTVVVTSSRICWIAEQNREESYEIDVPYICLHAIARDPNTYPVPCIYCQLNEDELKEIFFVPSHTDDLQSLFDAFSEAAELNPDAPEPGEQEDDDELIFDEESVRNSYQADMLRRFDDILVCETADNFEDVEIGQFDDADDSRSDLKKSSE